MVTFTYTIQVLLQELLQHLTEMVAAKRINITPAGDVSFNKLASASGVQQVYNATHATKITSFDMSALTTVSSFNTGTANQLRLNKRY